MIVELLFRHNVYHSSANNTLLYCSGHCSSFEITSRNPRLRTQSLGEAIGNWLFQVVCGFAPRHQKEGTGGCLVRGSSVSLVRGVVCVTNAPSIPCIVRLCCCWIGETINWRHIRRTFHR